jgi:site-specific recombinase XerD
MTTRTLSGPHDARQRRHTTGRDSAQHRRENHKKGRRYPPEPYTLEEAARLLKAAREAWQPGPTADTAGLQRYALYVLLWRSGVRINEALALEERDLDRDRRSIIVRRGKGDKRRVVRMDEWAWQQLDPWLQARKASPFGTVFCTILQPDAGTRLAATDVRRGMHAAGRRAGLRRRCYPHAWRHTHAIDLWREGVDLYAISTQLGHADLGTTAAYLRSLGADELLQQIADRPAPTMAFSLFGLLNAAG